MILVFGTLADVGTAYICARLLARDIEFLLLDGRQYLREFDVTWSLQQGVLEGAIRYGSRELPLREVRSVWIRSVDLPALPDHAERSDEEGGRAVSEAYASLIAFADTIPALVVNRPVAGLSNTSKPYQLQIIGQCGFRIPRTLVTTVPDQVHRFYDECRGRVIYKSVSDRRSIVRRVTAADLERADLVQYCPTQFQEYIAGVDVRVHTVGSRLFATEILTDAMDYRYAGLDGAARTMRGIELPDDVAERCLRLAAELGMIMSGIDLRRSPDGEYFCFEVNPEPGFAFFEYYTRQRIGDALVDLLARGTV